MRQTPADWEARSGRPYQPDDVMRALGHALRADEPCPTLFRYPGPCGLQHLIGRGDSPPPSSGLSTLGPPDRAVVWLSDVARHTGATGSARFGTVAVLRPLDLHAVRVTAPPFEPPTAIGRDPQVYAVPNAPIAGLPVVWVPPSRLDAAVPWDDLESVEDARDALGAGIEAERSEIARVLDGYLTEIEALRAAGAPGPGRPWIDVPEGGRRDLCARYGVRRTFSG